MVNFNSEPRVFFRGIELNDFMNSIISCGMASSHIIDVLDFTVR